MAKSSLPPRVVLDNEEWSRLPHQHVLRAKCGTMLKLQAAQAAIDGAFEDVVEMSQDTVAQASKGLARLLTIAFTGALPLAARLAQKALQA